MASKVGSKRKFREVEKEDARAKELEDISDDEYDPVSSSAPAGSSKAGSGAAPVLNLVGLKNALAGMKGDYPWIERLEVVSAEAVTVDASDDLKLELAFYGQALAAVTAARGELERQGIAHRRPDDYFATMMKSDQHMRKIKDKLLQEQKRMQAVDQRRKQKESLKYVKQLAAEKAKAKADEKKAGEDALKQWKRHRGDAEHAASAGDAPSAGGKKKSGGREAELEAAIAGHQKKFDEDRRGRGGERGGERGGDRGRSGGERGGDRGRSGGPSAKRRSKDRKYGHGGSKRDTKSNTSRSSGDFRAFSARRNSTPSGAFAGKGGGGGSGGKFKKNAGANRPGKRFRSSHRGGGGGGGGRK